MKHLHLHEDRALPLDPATRDVARAVYAETRSLPLVCMHGHVDAAVLADDTPFPDPARMLITLDHYVTRLVHAAGVPLEALGVGEGPGVERDPRRIWRRFCAHWHLFRGTPSRYWLTHELVDVFGVTLAPSAETADRLYDELAARLAEPEFRPRALFKHFGIEVLATTDSPLADLAAHRRLAAEGWGEQVIPTFRPDSLVHVGHAGWRAEVADLGRLTDLDTGDYRGYLAALRRRRLDFIAAGALATDHGHESAAAQPLPEAEAARVYAAARAGTAEPGQVQAFAGHMLFELARMSAEDGLVMQLHPGVLRDHDPAVLRRHGPDRGFDIPVPVEFTRSLRPLLAAFGHEPRFRMVAFTVDETTYSRELAPLAGVYPALHLGAPWWFLDSPHGLHRFRQAVTETAGFYRTAGFVDDTRAFASIPARHDLARRVDAGYLAELVAGHLLDLDEAIETAIDLAYHIPRRLYRRPAAAQP
ncbi:glucuronate isomerase [Rhizomonospora bruguierae]|uniref:glucuronate isomerase n=1 Tax=Rhizomonospora bruguierae TaxID=1581705 RepID=UPI001BCFD70A|nr:glucuronate isomerase [Micromonospora sp. NBRC 107566]